MNSFLEMVYRFNDYINAYIWQGIPDIVKGTLIVFVFSYLFRKQIKKYPVVFYLYPALIFLWFTFYGVVSLLPGDLFETWGLYDSWISDIGWFTYRLGLVTPIGIGFLVIVMFIGVLPKTKLVVEFFKIRSEMSIIGATLLVAHGIMRLGTARYYLNLTGEYQEGFNLYALTYGIIGPIILALILLPWVTSFKVVRRRIKPSTWKKLQTYFGVPLFIGMLLFGCMINVAWSIMSYSDVVDIWEITASSNGDPLSLGDGIYFSSNLLAAKIYFALLISYVTLRLKKVRQRQLSRKDVTQITPLISKKTA